MAVITQKLRGLLADIKQKIYPQGVLTVSLDDFDVQVHDGETAGGHGILARARQYAEDAAGNIKPPEASGVPAGTIMAFAMASAPAGWLKCNFQFYYARDYPALYAAIGQQFGGDGSGDDLRFAVPELRGEFVRGWIDDRLDNSTNGPPTQKGRSFGSWENHAYQRHQHEFTSDWIGDHSHWVPMGVRNTVQYSGFTAFNNAADSGRQSNGAGGHNVHGWTATVGGSDETRPQNFALLYCIKT